MGEGREELVCAKIEVKKRQGRLEVPWANQMVIGVRDEVLHAVVFASDDRNLLGF